MDHDSFFIYLVQYLVGYITYYEWSNLGLMGPSIMDMGFIRENEMGLFTTKNH